MSGRRRKPKASHISVSYDEDDVAEKDLNLTLVAKEEWVLVGYTQGDVKPKKAKDTAKAEHVMPTHATITSSAEVDQNHPDPPRNQGASSYCTDFLYRESVIQKAILRSQHHRNIGTPCTLCGKNLVSHRCKECFQCPMYCKDCIVEQHVMNPLHRIQCLKDGYFEDITLGELGLVFHVGHYGRPCPNTLIESGRRMTFVHRNGIQSLFVKFCHCHVNMDEFEQLISAQLYPATFQLPNTVFTFELLDEIQTHVGMSKGSVYDYHRAIQFLTNPVMINDVPDRYNELSRVLREWRYLAATRRSGQAHGIDKHFPHRRERSLAVRCFACPEVGLNIDEDTVWDTPDDEIHKVTRFISTDGNFRLQLIGKKRDLLDTPLNAGKGYFVENGPYRDYLMTVKSPADKSTCARLRAVRLQNIAKFKNAIVSGVVSVQCLRHYMFIPSGTVDLEKGECYASTDYAVLSVLSEGPIIPSFLNYDIFCQWSKKFVKRVRTNWPNLFPVTRHLSGAVGKMHIKGHDESCQNEFSMNYMENTGETCGENLESAWAEVNQAAASTKYMNAGNRHDTLDEFFMLYNWLKSRGLVLYLCKKYKACVAKLKEREEYFIYFTDGFSDEIVAKWSAMSTKIYTEKGNLVSPYIVNFKSHSPPSQANALKKLVSRETDSNHSRDAAFINEGLLIEVLQLRVKNGGNEGETLIDSLRERVKAWIELYVIRFPDVYEDASPTDFSSPEHVKLLFPSAWSRDERPAALVSYTDIEYELRLAMCYEALDDLKYAVKSELNHRRFKNDNICGQRMHTRSLNVMKALNADKTDAFDRYNRSREALLQLGLSEEEKSLQVLKKDELWGRDMGVPAGPGVTNEEEPWYWRAVRPVGLSKEQCDEWELENERVRWFRNRAARDRTREETEILREEILRVHASCVKMKSVWEANANQSGIEVGAKYYARKQAAMYDKFIEEAYNAIVETFGTAVAACSHSFFCNYKAEREVDGLFDIV